MQTSSCFLSVCLLWVFLLPAPAREATGQVTKKENGLYPVAHNNIFVNHILFLCVCLFSLRFVQCLHLCTTQTHNWMRITDTCMKQDFTWFIVLRWYRMSPKLHEKWFTACVHVTITLHTPQLRDTVVFSELLWPGTNCVTISSWFSEATCSLIKFRHNHLFTAAVRAEDQRCSSVLSLFWCGREDILSNITEANIFFPLNTVKISVSSLMVMWCQNLLDFAYYYLAHTYLSAELGFWAAIM